MSIKIEVRAWDGEYMYNQENIGDDFYFDITASGFALMVNEQFHECGGGVAEDHWKYVEKVAEFMLFTGLVDCDGVKIFGDDICQDHNGIGVVEYVNHKAAFRINYMNGTVKWFTDYNLKGERGSIKVIGNRHIKTLSYWRRSNGI